jgi:hypothetical protein
MMTFSKVGDTLIGIVLAVIGVAIIAVLVSRQAETPAVLKAAGGMFTTILNNAFSSL